TLRDPVCGMSVDMATATHRHLHEGREFGFCSAGCKARFVADPQAYLAATDPVCGMSVDRASAKWMLKHEGTRYYFCSEGCLKKFEADPARHLAGEHAAHAHRDAPVAAAPGSKWTCPMHPEIVADGPGDCPICGMALEPTMPAAAGEKNPELVDFT